MTKVIDISQQVTDLCASFGFDPLDVSQINLEPTTATVVVYLRNENGSFYLADGEVAEETHEFTVRTHK